MQSPALRSYAAHCSWVQPSLIFPFCLAALQQGSALRQTLADTSYSLLQLLPKLDLATLLGAHHFFDNYFHIRQFPFFKQVLN